MKYSEYKILLPYYVKEINDLKMSHHLVTSFDKDKFLLRGLALHESLMKHMNDFVLWILVFNEADEKSVKKLALPKVKILKLEDIEDHRMLAVKQRHTTREYALVTKPYALFYILTHEPKAGSVAWVDADLYFFSPPEVLWQEMRDASILLTENNFSFNHKKQEAFCGKYNAGFVIFKNDEGGKQALAWWKDRCLEWCFNRHEDGKFGEQLYMDQFPILFETKISKYKGANVAYWNIERYSIKEQRGNIVLKEKGRVISPILFYHYSGVTFYEIFGSIRTLYGRRQMIPSAVRLLYRPYELAVTRAFYNANKILGTEKYGIITGKMTTYIKRKINVSLVSYIHLALDPFRVYKRKIYQKINSIFTPIFDLLHIPRSFSLNSIDRKLKPYLSKIKNGFFVEAGANDGIAQSNTLYYEKYFGWSGLLIEAIPDLAKKCKENRPKTIVENVALVSSDYKNPEVTIRYSGLMSVVKGGMKTKQEEDAHIETGLKRIGKTAYEVSVKTSTLSALLLKHQIEKVDFLSLDVEGYELEVLKGLDFKKYRPRYVLIEARYKDEIDIFMANVNYREIAKLSGHDFIYEPK